MMKNPVIAYVGWLLLFAALGFYGYGIYEAIALSLKGQIEKNDFPEVLSTTVGAMQALLLTNLGIVLGISIAKPGSAVAKQVMLGTKNIDDAAKNIPEPLAMKDKIQLFALVIYIISLIACLITWGIKGFSPESKDVVAIISESGKMFIGVVLAYFTAVLSR